MADNLRLRVVLDLAERVLAPMKRISSSSSDAARALKAAKDRLKELNAQQAQVGEFRTLKTNLQETAAKLTEAQAKVGALARAYGQAGPPTRAMERDMARAKREAAALTAQHSQQQEKLQQLRTRLSAAGISTRELGAQSQRLRGDIAATNAAITEQTAKLRANAEQHKQLAKLRDQHAKAMLHTGMAAGAGLAMQAAGRKGVDVGMGPVKDYSKHEDAMIGIARQVPGARDEMGQLTTVYRQAEADVRELSGQIPIATTEITKMMTAAARMEVPTGQLKEFTLLASEMATAFDAVPDQLTESMGKVAKNFKIPLTDIRGLADSINYLDDNAISKGADIIDFLNRTSGVVSTVAMSAKDAAALGSTLLTLGERPETASTAANAIVQKFAAATKGTKKFQEAMAEIGLSSQDVQMGMSKDATATLDKVVAAIGQLPEDKRIGVMVELVGMEHSDTLAKLVDKPEELARQRQLANSKGADGSMAREAAARNAALSAQYVMLQNRVFNLKSAMGEQLAPVLTQLMKAVNPLLEKFTKWVQQNPTLVKWTLGTAIALSALLAAVGLLLVPMAILAGKAMLVRFVFARLALSLGGMRTAATAAGPAMGFLARMATWVGRVLSFVPVVLGYVGRALLVIGRVLMFTPWGRAIGLLATAAVMIYRNWDGIKGGLIAIWEQLSGATAAWWARTTAGAAALWQTLVSLKDRFFTAGGDLMDGLVNGITSRVQMVRDAIGGVADDVGAWFREKLGIASPSKVFMQYGGWISEGAALGIQGGQGAVRTAALAMATAATTALPMAAGAAALGPDGQPPLQAQALRLDTRPPLMAPATGPGVGGGSGGSTYNITINAAPGMDPKELVRLISAEMDRRERSQKSRVLSSMSDID
jgi:TP901 family phage tail tape measure protein